MHHKMTRKNKILEEILPLRIIEEVEKWPEKFKNKVWTEVAKALIKNGDTYSQAVKKCKIMDLIKKWRNRETFKRQMLVDKKIRERHNIKKKKYVYYKHMLFLLPHIQLMQAPPPTPTPTPRRRPRPPTAPRCTRRTRCTTGTDPASLLSMEHIDEDKNFLMSLSSSFRRMNDNEKPTAKMEILNMIKNVRKHAGAATECTCAGYTLPTTTTNSTSRLR